MVRGMLVPLLLVLALQPQTAAAAGAEFEFQQLNRDYSYPTTNLVPIQQGPMSIRLGSPENTLSLRRHLVKLRPLPDGGFQAELSVLFDGQGRLEAELNIAGATQQLEDEVTLPRQSLELNGRIEISHGQDGYVIKATELHPPTLTLQIQSRLGTDLVQTCRRLAFLSLAGVACDSLQESLSQATFTLPAGQTFLLPDSWLSPEEHQRLDAYLQLGKGK